VQGYAGRNLELLNRYTRKGIESSNLSPSAIFLSG